MIGAGTNKRNALQIRACLEAGSTVLIFAIKPEQEISFNGLKVDLVKGLENPLIAILAPEWNRR